MKKKEKYIIDCYGFGQRLRKLRKNQGLTQTELAKKIGYKTSVSISNIESGRTPPDITILAKIAACLDADLHWLVLGKPSPLAVKFAEQLRPCVGLYVSKLSDEIKGLRKKLIELNINKHYRGDNKQKEAGRLSENLIKKQKEVDTISEVFVKIFSNISP